MVGWAGEVVCRRRKGMSAYHVRLLCPLTMSAYSFFECPYAFAHFWSKRTCAFAPREHFRWTIQLTPFSEALGHTLRLAAFGRPKRRPPFTPGSGASPKRLTVMILYSVGLWEWRCGVGTVRGGAKCSEACRASEEANKSRAGQGGEPF